jgi:hypothetical protein
MMTPCGIECVHSTSTRNARNVCLGRAEEVAWFVGASGNVCHFRAMVPAQRLKHNTLSGGWGLPLVQDVGEGDEAGGHKRRKKSWKDIYAERMQVECNV